MSLRNVLEKKDTRALVEDSRNQGRKGRIARAVLAERLADESGKNIRVKWDKGNVRVVEKAGLSVRKGDSRQYASQMHPELPRATVQEIDPARRNNQNLPVAVVREKDAAQEFYPDLPRATVRDSSQVVKNQNTYEFQEQPPMNDAIRSRRIDSTNFNDYSGNLASVQRLQETKPTVQDRNNGSIEATQKENWFREGAINFGLLSQELRKSADADERKNTIIGDFSSYTKGIISKGFLEPLDYGQEFFYQYTSQSEKGTPVQQQQISQLFNGSPKDTSRFRQALEPKSQAERIIERADAYEQSQSFFKQGRATARELVFAIAPEVGVLGGAKALSKLRTGNIVDVKAVSLGAERVIYR